MGTPGDLIPIIWNTVWDDVTNKESSLNIIWMANRRNHWHIIFSIKTLQKKYYYGIETDENRLVTRQVKSTLLKDVTSVFNLKDFYEINLVNAKAEFLEDSPMIQNPQYSNNKVNDSANFLMD